MTRSHRLHLCTAAVVSSVSISANSNGKQQENAGWLSTTVTQWVRKKKKKTPTTSPGLCWLFHRLAAAVTWCCFLDFLFLSPLATRSPMSCLPLLFDQRDGLGTGVKARPENVPAASSHIELLLEKHGNGEMGVNSEWAWEKSHTPVAPAWFQYTLRVIRWWSDKKG